MKAVTMDFDALIGGAAHDPHWVLGAHPGKTGTVIRTMRRGAHEVAAVTGTGEKAEREKAMSISLQTCCNAASITASVRGSTFVMRAPLGRHQTLCV